MHAINGPRVIIRIEVLQLALDLFQRVGIEQFAELRLSEQLPKLCLIDRQGLRPSLGQRRVAVIDVVGDIPKQERRRERRGRR
jgi:hypothetical protein